VLLSLLPPWCIPIIPPIITIIISGQMRAMPTTARVPAGTPTHSAPTTAMAAATANSPRFGLRVGYV
jgi:hypothetical protein